MYPRYVHYNQAHIYPVNTRSLRSRVNINFMYINISGCQFWTSVPVIRVSEVTPRTTSYSYVALARYSSAIAPSFPRELLSLSFQSFLSLALARSSSLLSLRYSSSDSLIFMSACGILCLVCRIILSCLLHNTLAARFPTFLSPDTKDLSVIITMTYNCKYHKYYKCSN